MNRITSRIYRHLKNVKNHFNILPQIPNPTIFMIETFLGCNLKCPECAVGADIVDRKKGAMSLGNFKIIADKIRPYARNARTLYLHIWGEPLLNKDIFEMIRIGSSIAPVNISTNACILTDKMSEQLIKSGVRNLIISIDGITQTVYEQYRVGGDLNTALHYFKKLVLLNKKYNANVNIFPQFCVFKHNEIEMDKFKEYCEKIGAREPSFKAPYLRKNSRFQLSSNNKYHRSVETDPAKRLKKMKRCRSPYEDFTILLDGTVVICCYDHNGFTRLGNIFENDVKEIYNGRKYRAIREAFTKATIPEFCQLECLEY